MNGNGLDLGIAGRRALVCGSTKGLGLACAIALLRAGVIVTLNGRSDGSLAAAIARVEADTGQRPAGVVADTTTPAGRTALLSACPAPDILVTNAAGPPPGQFEEWDEAVWQAAVNANMIAPIQLIRTVVGPMRERRWGRILNITSAAVKAPLPLLGLSNGARSGLTGFVAGLAREIARDGITVNNLLPGHFETDRLRAYAAALAKTKSIDVATALDQLATANPSGRIGQPHEFGAACAFLASEAAGFITGQNLLLDGGAYAGVL